MLLFRKSTDQDTTPLNCVSTQHNLTISSRIRTERTFFFLQKLPGKREANYRAAMVLLDAT